MSIDTVSTRERDDLWRELLGYRDKVFCLCLGFAGNAADAREEFKKKIGKRILTPPPPPPSAKKKTESK